MIKLLSYNNFYLVGIKGVAMTALAQILIDAGKTVRGCDVAEEFVTQELLDAFDIKVDVGFDSPLPPETDAVIYTSAHQSHENPQVKTALTKGIPIVTQAEAIAEFFNAQKGIAVSGVGGKSTTSAMIAWILEKVAAHPSFFCGVGNIPGLNRTGKWNPTAEYLVAEADEYVTNPRASETGEQIIPKFSFLHPYISVCTNLRYDHPDVYRDFEHTKQVYGQFFSQTHPGGALIVSDEDEGVIKRMPELSNAQFKILTFGHNHNNAIDLVHFTAETGKTVSRFVCNDESYELVLHIPGKYNVMNALAAILACQQIGINPQDAATALSSFRSTKRRFEYIGEKHGVQYYDDYAHHPHEIVNVIDALNEWYPNQHKVIAFQSHTFTRTKQLFTEFVDSFAKAQEVVMIDIFSSAREAFDPTITSTLLCEAINKKFGIPAQNVGTIENLVQFCKTNLKSGDVLLTVGAGDIYKIHEQL